MDIKIYTVDGDPYVRAMDLATAKGMPRQSVYNRVASGEFPSIEFAGARLIPLAVAEAWEPVRARGWHKGRKRKVDPGDK